jgi:hypothetical protein
MAPPAEIDPRYHYNATDPWDYWLYNTAVLFGGNDTYRTTGDGLWYSLNATKEGVHWRNPKIVKAINADCQARALDYLVETRGEKCFATCPEPSNTSSPCWINCFFETVLGQGHNSSLTPAGGMTAAELNQAWLAGFASDEPSRGGCSPCPSSGPCPDAQPLDEMAAQKARLAARVLPAPRAWRPLV